MIEYSEVGGINKVNILGFYLLIVKDQGTIVIEQPSYSAYPDRILDLWVLRHKSGAHRSWTIAVDVSLAVHAEVGIHAINPIRKAEVFFIRCLILDEQPEQKRERHADGKPTYVEKRKELPLTQGPKRGDEDVSEHIGGEVLVAMLRITWNVCPDRGQKVS